MRCLLDKVTVRRTVEGLLKLAEDRDLNEAELFALDLFQRARLSGSALFIVPPTAKVLRRLGELPRYGAVIRLFRARAEVLWPARYFTRWARRLRDFDFTPEDAAVLALATFGTDEGGTLLGTHSVAAFDQPMIQNWATRQADILERLTAMQQDIPSPYHEAALPEVKRPEFITL